MIRIEHYVGCALRAVAITLLAAILVLMVANVANRFFHFAGLDWNDEIIELMLVWMIFTGSAEVWRVNQHFAVDLVPLMMKRTRFEKPFRVFISVGCLVLIVASTLVWRDADQRRADDCLFIAPIGGNLVGADEPARQP